MNNAAIRALSSIEFATPHLPRAEQFFIEHWGLEKVGREHGISYFRGAGTEHHILRVRQAQMVACTGIDFSTGNREEVDALADRVRSEFPTTSFHPPAPLQEPGGGYGFSFTDAEGRQFNIVCDRDSHKPSAVPRGRPAKLSHVVVNSADADFMTAKFSDLFGFRVRDRMRSMDFLGCNTDHHSIAFCRFGDPGFGHVAFEMPTFDDLMIGVGRLVKGGTQMQWGLGRHGPGNNIFAYFLAPDGYTVEYTAEMEQVDDTRYVPRGPEYWDLPENREQWGLSPNWSPAMGEAQSGLIPFVPRERLAFGGSTSESGRAEDEGLSALRS
jgi:catechol 2,3-dioxygenase-like lactoylglutathione lyase family enzyme